MARKIFQDFAHVLCQKFVEVPSNRDIVDMVILGDGILALNVTEHQATHNGLPITPLSFGRDIQQWLDERLSTLDIPPEELVNVSLRVVYSVTLRRRGSLNWLNAEFDFSCVGEIAVPDRIYSSTLKEHKEWGLGQVNSSLQLKD